ncbi:MAG: hypothetical protein ACR2H6_08140 [Pyrinomonadaceae bacterium]
MSQKQHYKRDDQTNNGVNYFREHSRKGETSCKNLHQGNDNYPQCTPLPGRVFSKLEKPDTNHQANEASAYHGNQDNYHKPEHND